MRRWLPPAAALLVWLLIGGVFGPFPGKLAEVQRNDNAAFLPSGTESTRVMEVLESFSEQDDVLPAIAVLEYEEQVTERDVAEVVQLADRFAGLADVVGEPGQPVPSEDGLAIQFVVPLDGSQTLEAGDTVERMREMLADVAPNTYVTGPAGFVTDLGEAFSGIDGIVRGATGHVRRAIVAGAGAVVRHRLPRVVAAPPTVAGGRGAATGCRRPA